jgi:glycine dehydrogenase
MILDQFVNRHIGPRDSEAAEMCKTIGVESVDQLISETVPASILAEKPLSLPPAMNEYEYTAYLRDMVSNKLYRSFIGQGWPVRPFHSYNMQWAEPCMVHFLHSHQAEISRAGLKPFSTIRL